MYKYPPPRGGRGRKKKTMEKAGPNNNWHYNKGLQTFANNLRKNMTKSEACLWKYALRAGKLNNWQFRRQRPVLNFIADFMCKELLLIIELDGYTHNFESTIEKDKIKEKALTEVGFKVIRFNDEEVLNDLDNVIRVVEQQVEERSVELNIPPPGPRRRGK